MACPKEARYWSFRRSNLNATQAAIRAGYSAKTAGQIGERLLKKVEVQALLSERMRAREKRTENLKKPEIQGVWIIRQRCLVVE